MNPVSEQFLHCDGCGRVVPMKPEWAGRRLRCKCGGIVQAPAAGVAAAPKAKPQAIPLADEAPSDGVGYGIAPNPAAKPVRPIRHAARATSIAVSSDDDGEVRIAPVVPAMAVPTPAVLGY